MTLHIINSNKPFLTDWCDDSDEILLIEDGVYQSLGPHRCFVLRSDRLARGLPLREGQTEVDYDGFVALCEQHSKVVSW